MNTIRMPTALPKWLGLCLAGLSCALASAQGPPAGAVPAPPAAPSVVRLTLEEAKHRALSNNKLINLATLNAEGKAFAVKAARADYFPKVSATAIYLHFDDDLGTVLTTRGRHVTGPRGTPLVTLPPTTINVPVIQQDTSFVNVGAVQPLTDLLKVRQGVRIAQADEDIARAELEAGVRKLASGVEQLYWGLLAVRRIQAGAREGVQGAELLARTGSLEARTALVEARQGLQQADRQAADLQEQLLALLDLPPCTVLELVEPELPVLPFRCADEVVELAVANSPEVRQDAATVQKAEAALKAGKLDYVPSIAVTGGYLNQTAASYVQQDIGYVGVVGSYTILDWGKRRNVVRERQNLVAMANLKLAQTTDDVGQKARKLFREAAEAREALQTADELAALRKDAEKQAMNPEALKDPTKLIQATKDRALAEVEAIKADLAYRQAVVQLKSLIGQ